MHPADDPLEVENDVCDVLLDAGDRRKLVRTKVPRFSSPDSLVMRGIWKSSIGVLTSSCF
jgi:hypothetical protein